MLSMQVMRRTDSSRIACIAWANVRAKAPHPITHRPSVICHPLYAAVCLDPLGLRRAQGERRTLVALRVPLGHGPHGITAVTSADRAGLDVLRQVHEEL
jgi:hypothetical protein